MKRFALLALVGVVTLGTIGCNTTRINSHSRSFSAPRRAPSYALAVTVHGGLQPTAAQWLAIQAKVAEELSWRGAVLVTDLSLADQIIRIDFRPNPNDPENSGQIVVLGIRANPYSGIARVNSSGPYSSSFSFANNLHSSRWWGSSYYYSGDYYNYTGPWENGYTSGYTTVTVVPKVTPPPHRHRPGFGEICPPDALHPRPSFASQSAGSLSTGSALAAAPVYTSPEPSRRWTGERSAWRTEASAGRPERTFTRADGTTGTYTRGESGSWRSARSESGSTRSERTYARSDGSSRSEGSWWRNNSSSSSDSGGQPHMTAGASRSETVYNSPSPSYSSSSSSSSSGSLSASSSGSYSSPSPAMTTTETTSNTIER